MARFPSPFVPLRPCPEEDEVTDTESIDDHDLGEHQLLLRSQTSSSTREQDQDHRDQGDQGDLPIYENLNNYEREEEGDELDLEDEDEDEDEDENENEDEDYPEDYVFNDQSETQKITLSSKVFSSTPASASASASASTPAPSSSSTIYRARPLPPLPVKKMPGPNVPKPGPAKLTKNAGLAEWLEEAKQCHYLPEQIMKQLCEMVKECLMEGASSSSFSLRAVRS